MRTILFLVGLFLFNECSAQNTFQRTIDADNSEGRTSIFDPTDNLVIATRYEDFNFSLAGIQLVKYDNMGNNVFGKVYEAVGGGNILPLANDIAATSDGGYALVADRITTSSTDSVYVMKVDANGSPLWAKGFAPDKTGLLGTNALRIEEASNGDLLVGGEIDINDSAGFRQDMYVTRLNPLGNVLWNNRITSTTPNDFNRLGAIKETSSGDIMVGARSTNSGSVLMSLSSAGQLQWAQKYDTNTEELEPVEIEEVVVTGFRIYANTSFQTNNHALARIDVDQSGNFSSGVKYRFDGTSMRVDAVEVLADHSAVAVGSTSYGNGSISSVKITPSGQGSWNRVYGSHTGFEKAASITRTYGGGYMIVGSGEKDSLLIADGGGALQTYLIKTDSSGQSFGCEDTMTVITDPASYTSSAHSISIVPLIGGWANAAFTSVDAYNTTDVCSTLGLQELATQDLQVYPNPTRDRIQIGGLGDENWVHHLFDTEGRLIMNSRSMADIHRMDLQDVSPGTYVLHSVSEEATSVNRLELIK